MELIGHLVGVSWADAHADNMQEVDLTEIQAARSYMFTTYGILVRDDREQHIKDPLIAVAHERGEDGRYRGVTYVPLALMVKILDFGLPKPRRPRKAVVSAQISSP